MDTAFRHRVNAARVAIRNQTGFFNQQRGRVSSEWKPDETRVTFADFAISEKICEELRRSFPDDQFLSEESGLLDEVVPVESRYSWVLDPIDGTNNYALGMSACAISLALMKQGHPVYGLIYDGSTGELLEGGSGRPILVDGKKFTPANRPFEKRTSIIALHFPLPAGRPRQFEALLETYRVRSLGSASLHLAYVALGRIDGVIDERVRIWDVAAACALIEASGRKIIYMDENPFPMKAFESNGAFIRYAAGSEGFLTAVQNWLG
ncbi:inositol monophosphatase family protein [Puniceicoccales bacterium CK1056]|uniref:Inositol monophosphatase family protein n=1 Tax=Oceanipulchritudo coccoides TaxID=2706888 RepID=A0A6B2LXB0_9BACT|nr:inositol monophosphatase family protein [Oceanipulchritudo coccoides]NDV61171.1 inositol monophosphatase family protein [Oceanipulchritudo coccoides]